MCVGGGGASQWVLIPAMFRVDADVVSSPTWEMQDFSFSWEGMSRLWSSGFWRCVAAYYISTPVFWKHIIFSSSGYKKFCPSWQGLLCEFRHNSLNRKNECIPRKGRVQPTSHRISTQKIIIRTIIIGIQWNEKCSRYLLINAASNHPPSGTFLKNWRHFLWHLC
jgi:hypothetical protein